MSGEETGRKADRVARDLLSQIAAGDPAPGDTLPTEDELAVRYAVNRSVVREAIKLLEVHRLVRPVRRRGTEVLDPFASLSPEVLAAMLRGRSGKVDVAFLESLLEIRTLLDVHICGLAAERRTKADLKALEEQVEVMRGVAGDEQAYANASFEFGLRLARATHNPINVMFSHWNRAVASDLPRVFNVSRASTGPHLEGLALLIEQLRAKNVDQARALVAAFHKWANPRLLAAAALENGDIPSNRERQRAVNNERKEEESEMTTTTTELAPKKTAGPAWHRRVHGLNVVSVAGTFHEMGRQHGTLLADEIRRGPLPYYRSFVEKITRGAAPGPLGGALRHAVRRTIGKSVAKAMPPFVLETLQGMAEGANLPYEEVLEGATMPDTLLWLAARFVEMKRVPPAVRHRLSLGLGCTSAIAWGSATKDGKLLHARNLDYHGVSCWPSTSTVLFHTPAKGQRYVSCTAAGVPMGGFTAMNEAGLTLTVHQHMFTHRTRLGGTPIAIVGDIVMREAKTLADAEEILAKHHPIGCWTYLIADGNRREVLCWEEDPGLRASRRIKDEEVFGYANIYLDEKLGETERDLYPTYWRHNHGRYARATQLLNEQRGALDAAGMAAILGDIGDERCRLRESIAMSLTVGSVVFRPEDGTFWVGTGEAPTSHGAFIPFSLRTMDHAPEAGTLTPGDAIDPRARDAFERFRRAYVAYVDHEDVGGARRELALACELQPAQPAYHAVAGIMGLSDGDAADAARMLDRAIAIGHPDEPRLASFHLWRARAADVVGDRTGATRNYRTVLALNADATVRAAAEQGLSRPFTKRRASRVHVDMALGDVMAP